MTPPQQFVVDGNWTTDHTAPKESDESGNENNVLTPDRITKDAAAGATMMNSAAPDATTAALAAEAPLEKKEEKPDGLPGTFPETPALDLEKKELSINPLPAAPGAVNPVQLSPGDKIPDALIGGSTTDNVKLDADSYARADALPEGAIAFLNSAEPTSTTAALAADAPIETKVPEVVKESQEKADAAPEASAVPAEVAEKAEVEQELLDKVTEAPSTSEGTAGLGTEKTENTVDAKEAAASVAAAAAAVGGAAVVGAVAAKDLAAEKAAAAASTAQANATAAATNLPDSVKKQLPESVQNAIGTTDKEETIQDVSAAVPMEVKQSIAEAGKSPEAAANTEAVVEKMAMENELLKEVKPTEDVAAAAAAGTSLTAAEESKTEKSEVAKTAEKAVEKAEKAIHPSETNAQEQPSDVAKGTDQALENAGVAKADEAPASTDATAGTAAAAAPSDATPTVTVNGNQPAPDAEPAAEAKSEPATEAKADSSNLTPEPSSPTKTEGATPSEKKKKNRFSALLSKLRPKKSSK